MNKIDILTSILFVLLFYKTYKQYKDYEIYKNDILTSNINLKNKLKNELKNKPTSEPTPALKGGSIDRIKLIMSKGPE